MRLLVIIVCLGFVCCQVGQAESSAKSISENIGETKLIRNGESKTTGKRDSTDQTSVPQQIRDETFRPIYRPLYYANQGFRPTVNTYEASAAASPQAYYDKRPEPQEATGEASYRGPYSPAHHEQNSNYVQNEQTSGTGSSANSDAPQPVYERVPLTHLHYQHLPAFMLAQRQRASAPVPIAPSAGQQPIQYVIAIPLSYARQLQQQLSHIPMHASQAYALPHQQHQVQAAATQSLAYRPFHYNGEAAANGHRFIQIPSSMIYAAANEHKPPSNYAQAGYYQQAQPIYQAQELLPTQQSLYAYQLQVPQVKHQQQQQQQPQSQQQQIPQQYQQQQQHGQYVQIGGGAKTTALKSLGYYVQSNNQHEQQQQQQSINPYAIGAPPSPPVSLVRVSAPRAYLHMPPVVGGGHQLYVRPTESLAPKLSYVTPQPYSSASFSIVPPSVPYLSQPGAIHYGSHLYHPAMPLTTQSTKADFDNAISAHGNSNVPAPAAPIPTTTSSAAHNHQHHHHHHSQPQQQSQQQQVGHKEAAASETSVVKYP